MRLMKHVDKRAGIYRVRIVVPPAARHAFADLPKSGDFAVSLGTRSEAEAFAKAPPIIANIKARIDAALKPLVAVEELEPAIPSVAVMLRPSEVETALERWRVVVIDQAQAEHFSGVAATFDPLGDEAVALSELRYKLSDAAHWRTIPEFEERMIDALASQGLNVPAGHAVLDQPAARMMFGRAWENVEHHTDQFRRGVFTGWPEEGIREGPLRPSPVTATPTGGTKLKALLERYIAAKTPKGQEDLRYHWRRLVERFGDVDAVAVDHEGLEGFLIELRRFPKTRRPEITKLPFLEVLEKHPDVAPSISEPTVWKHFVSYSQVFSYARSMRLIDHNPVEAVMPSKPKPTKEVRHYEPKELATIFSRPMFTGCTNTHTANGFMKGYRTDPGTEVLKDGRYWMPILALFHGNRMEEWGGAKIADIKRDGDIHYLDLRDRQVKTLAAKRLMPLHPTVVAMGFLEYVERLRAEEQEYVFPEFPHDTSEADDPESSTRYFTKWWGLWCDANGMPDPTVNFHSFRHTFKRECRGVISEEIHDLLTGHKGKGSAGRIYGRGGHLEMLAKELRKVKITGFPLG
jgi:integrase